MRKSRPFAALAAALLLLPSGPAAPVAGLVDGPRFAAPARAETGKRGRVTGLPIPRFVSLRPDTVNLRTGPGLRYPVEWVYTRAGMPVEVIGEYGIWRQVRDWQGDTGWVHQVMLQADRTARILGETPRPLVAEPAADAGAVARLEPGVIAELERCRDRWCRLSAGGHTGWMRRADFYGAYPGERLTD
jgi:SH3-like domain-containing protein